MLRIGNKTRYLNVLISESILEKMKKSIAFAVLFLVAASVTKAQQPLTLDSCRQMALRNNTQLRISEAKIKAAHYNRKAAFATYFPGIDVTGGYLYSSREISLLNEDLQKSLPQLGTALVQNLATAAASNPVLAGVLATLGGGLEDPLNQLGQTVVDEFHTDTRNMFAGTITLMQPIYMGGKIRAYNKITHYAEDLAKSQHDTEVQELVYKIDELYWQVVSLGYKKQLAESYARLLDELDNNVQTMITEGVATRSDGLAVAVKANEAQITLTQVTDGLSLAKMVLAQMCGLPIDTDLQLSDEVAPDENEAALQPETVPIDIETIFANRSEIQSLSFAEKIFQNKQKVVMSGMLPTLALTGSYTLTNPTLYNGFEREFKGLFNIGIVLRIPILHWGENIYKYRSAKADSYIAQLNMKEAKEKIELQVNQASFKVNEAYKRLDMTKHNLENADENLHNAQTGFKEGVLTTSNLLEAQTAWLKAQSEYIDARIGVKLCDAYLSKAVGMMQY